MASDTIFSTDEEHQALVDSLTVMDQRCKKLFFKDLVKAFQEERVEMLEESDTPILLFYLQYLARSRDSIKETEYLLELLAQPKRYKKLSANHTALIIHTHSKLKSDANIDDFIEHFYAKFNPEKDSAKVYYKAVTALNRLGKDVSQLSPHFE